MDGTLIGESLRRGASLDGQGLRVRRIRRGGPAELSAVQRAAGVPKDWTLIEFELGDEHAAPLADALADALNDGGWYTDFRSKDETFVVFARRVFRYRRGDPRGRADAQAYGRSAGVPDSQLDWPE